MSETGLPGTIDSNDRALLSTPMSFEVELSEASTPLKWVPKQTLQVEMSEGNTTVRSFHDLEPASIRMHLIPNPHASGF